MDAIQYQHSNGVRPIRLTVPRRDVKALVGGLLRVLAESARGAEFDAIFCRRDGAQFASLSRAQQNSLLDRGYRPR